jgi:hypothetical protein
MAKPFSICSHPALPALHRALQPGMFKDASASSPSGKKSAPPRRVFFRAPLRIVRFLHPISCGYSVTSTRFLSTSLRRRSDRDAPGMRIVPPLRADC